MKSPQSHTQRQGLKAGEVRELSLLVSVPEAAHLLNLSIAFTWKLVNTGRLEAVRIDRRVQVRRTVVEEFVMAHRTPADTHHSESGLQDLA